MWAVMTLMIECVVRSGVSLLSDSDSAYQVVVWIGIAWRTIMASLEVRDASSASERARSPGRVLVECQYSTAKRLDSLHQQRLDERTTRCSTESISRMPGPRGDLISNAPVDRGLGQH
jgi:hypothetical protein